MKPDRIAELRALCNVPVRGAQDRAALIEARSCALPELLDEVERLRGRAERAEARCQTSIKEMFTLLSRAKSAEAELQRWRSIGEALVTSDPDEVVADRGDTVLDVCRHDMRELLPPSAAS